MEDLKLDSPVYRQANGYVYLTLKNNIAKHKKTISSEVMKLIEQEWASFNNTQQEIMATLLYHKPEATLDDFAKHVKVSEQALRNNLNALIDKGIIEKVTVKERDRNALYRFNSQLDDSLG